MATEVTVLKSFLRKKADNKVPDGEIIIVSLTENEDLFPNLPFPVPGLMDVNKRLSGADVTAKSGDKMAGEVLKTINKEWVTKFGTTAVAV